MPSPSPLESGGHHYLAYWVALHLIVPDGKSPSVIATHVRLTTSRQGVEWFESLSPEGDQVLKHRRNWFRHNTPRIVSLARRISFTPSQPTYRLVTMTPELKAGLVSDVARLAESASPDRGARHHRGSRLSPFELRSHRSCQHFMA